VLEIAIKVQRPCVEEMFVPYRTLIGDDFDGYRNHVYRCVTYAMHFLGNETEHEKLVETAFVYHDIGLWTDKKLAYLEPSEALALGDNKKNGWGLNSEALRNAIHWHHKIFKYQGIHANVVEACRKADWIDATQGWCRKGMRRLDIVKVESTFPNCGFHKTLLRLAKQYGGSTLGGGVQTMRGIVKW
jgi:hypothetical protein